MTSYWTYISQNPVAAYAAGLSTLTFLMALPLTIESYRKAKRDRGLLHVERADAGYVVQEGWRYENVTISLINVGGPTVSITGYEIRVYEGLWNILLKRNPIIHRGDGWKIARGEKSFSLSLKDGASPPFPVKSGEPTRLEIHADRLWVDRRSRRVMAWIKFSHSKKPLKIAILPNDPWSYTDARGIQDSQRKLATLSVHRKSDRGWEAV